MKSCVITIFIFLMSIYVSEVSAQQRDIKPAPKVVKIDRTIKTTDKEKITTGNSNGEQHLQSGTNNSSSEVISSGNMTGTPEKKEIKEQSKPTVESCKELIVAMEKKMEWVKNNPEEDKKAKQSGWYDQINNEIEKQKLILKELQSR